MRIYVLLTAMLLATCNMLAQQTINIDEKVTNEATLALRTGSVHFKTPGDIMNTARSKGARISPDGYRWIDRISNMPSHYRDFYNTYKALIDDVINNERGNWTTDYTKATKLSNGSYGVKIYTYSGDVTLRYDSSQDINQQINDKVQPIIADNWDDASCFMNFVCMSLSYDIPEAFWIDSTFKWTSEAGMSASMSGSNITAHYEQSIYLILQSGSFDIRRTDLASETKIKTEAKNFRNAITDILGTVSDKSTRYETLLGLNNWLTSHNHYNTNINTASSLAWSPLSSLCGLQSRNAPVCEGYARAFMALCNKLDIPCVLSTGDAKESRSSRGEAHMWNEVQMDNNLWYAVDVTWNDPLDSQGRNISGKENSKWFLLGSDDVVSTNWTFSQSHPKSIPWPVEDKYLAIWDYDISSLITHTHYDTPTSITQHPSTITQHPSTPIFTLDGRQLNAETNSLPKGIYIVNGKKRVNYR